jgi:hypothetical protein
MQGFSALDASDNIRKMIRMARDGDVRTLLVGVPYPTLFSSQPIIWGDLSHLKAALTRFLT